MRAAIKETYSVEFDDIDQFNSLNLFGLGRYIQNISIHHTEELGFGYYKNNGKKPQYYWVLSRVKYVLKEPVNWRDNFSINTYIGGFHKLFTVKLYDIEDYTGKKIGYVIADYILMDVDKGRPIKAIEISEDAPDDFKFNYTGEVLEKLKIPTRIMAQEIRKAYYSELDMNGHMNNVEYIKWIVDILPEEVQQEKVIESLQINYNASVMYQDEVRIIAEQEDENTYYVAGVSRDGKKNHFTSKLILRDH